MDDDIFFNTLSFFQNTAFENLKIGDKIRTFIKQTNQPFIANSVSNWISCICIYVLGQKPMIPLKRTVYK